MPTDRFAFYAKNYVDIRHLVNFDEEVRKAYPKELWGALQKYFKETFEAESFAGLSDWECDDPEDGPDDGFAFWNRAHFDSEREQGSFFYIDELEQAALPVEMIERRELTPLVPCYLWFEGRRGPNSVTSKKLINAARRAGGKLKKAGLKEVQGEPDVQGCHIQIDVGDLVHISTLGNKQRNFAELKKRAEKLVRACIPVIERAAQM